MKTNQVVALVAGLGLLTIGGCTRNRAADQPAPPSINQDHDAAARKVGHAAYHVSQDAEKVMEKAGHEMKVAGKEMHQGWKEAKQEDNAKRNVR